MFETYSPQTLRKAIEIELQTTNDPKMAAVMAMKKLAKDPEYYDMKKAKDTSKLVKKVITNKRGKRQTVYVKISDEDKKKDDTKKIKLKMRFDSHDLLFNFNLIGFEERVGFEKTSKKSLKTTKKTEDNIIAFDKEYTSVIDKKGNVLFSKHGNYDEIDFDKDEIEQLRNSEILTHTHPEDKSFSVEDVFLGLSLGIKELRVKTPNNTYSFKISHIKQSDGKYDLKNKNTMFMGMLVDLNVQVLDFLRKKVKEGKINQKEAEKEHREMFWEMVEKSPILANDFNIEYRKIKK